RLDGVVGADCEITGGTIDGTNGVVGNRDQLRIAELNRYLLDDLARGELIDRLGDERVAGARGTAGIGHRHARRQACNQQVQRPRDRRAARIGEGDIRVEEAILRVKDAAESHGLQLAGDVRSDGNGVGSPARAAVVVRKRHGYLLRRYRGIGVIPRNGDNSATDANGVGFLGRSVAPIDGRAVFGGPGFGASKNCEVSERQIAGGKALEGTESRLTGCGLRRRVQDHGAAGYYRVAQVVVNENVDGERSRTTFLLVLVRAGDVEATALLGRD